MWSLTFRTYQIGNTELMNIWLLCYRYRAWLWSLEGHITSLIIWSNEIGIIWHNLFSCVPTQSVKKWQLWVSQFDPQKNKDQYKGTTQLATWSGTFLWCVQDTVDPSRVNECTVYSISSTGRDTGPLFKSDPTCEMKLTECNVSLVVPLTNNHMVWVWEDC